MKPNPYPTPFIGFEGIDGSGQTTQAHLLIEALEKLSIKALYTKGPTRDSDAGRRIYEVLEGGKRIGHKELQELYMEDHGIRLEKEIIPALKDGTWAISDRYVFSGFTYGAAEGVDIEPLLKMTGSYLSPNIIFYLSISAKEAMERIDKRGNPRHSIFEKEDSLSKNKEMYEKILPQFQGLSTINGEQSIEKVHEDILNTVKDKFSL